MTRRSWSIGLATVVVLATAVTGTSRGLDVPRAGATSSATIGNLAVFVGYAENKESQYPNPASFPVPWVGAPDTQFLGGPYPGTGQCGTLPNCYDAGAVRLDNLGTTPVTVDSMNVDDHSSITGGKVFANQWGSFTVQPGTSVILTENAPFKNPTYDNFDTSSYPSTCIPITVAPTVTLTIAKTPYTLVDSTHVLDTGGIDPGSCTPKHNESTQWRAIGTAGTATASLALSPATQRHAAGTTAVLTATLLDGGGSGLPHVPVTFQVTAGPDAGTTGTAVTDWSGHAQFSYPNSGEGEDAVVATVQVPNGSFTSPVAATTWTDDSTSGWTLTDIGGAVPAGTSALDLPSGTWTVAGGGDGLGATADTFSLLSRPVVATGGVTAHLTSASGSDPDARAGVMLRASTAADAPYYGVFASPGGELSVQYRSGAGATAATLTSISGSYPEYVWAGSSAAGFTAYTSDDGYFWRPIPGSSVAVGLGASPVGGLAVTSGSAGSLQTATFDSVAVTSTPPLLVPPLPCPAPWSCADIGNPSLSGNQSFDPGTARWTVTAAGTDIGGTSDQFRFVSQPLSGDTAVSARIVSQTNTSSNAKAGVMLRAGSGADAAEYSVVVSPGAGIKVQLRSATGATTVKLANPSGTAPVYLKVTRVGNTFSASTSSDGNSWQVVPNSAVTVSLPSSLLGGLAVTSHNGSALCTVVFDHVALGS